MTNPDPTSADSIVRLSTSQLTGLWEGHGDSLHEQFGNRITQWSVWLNSITQYYSIDYYPTVALLWIQIVFNCWVEGLVEQLDIQFNGWVYRKNCKKKGILLRNCSGCSCTFSLRPTLRKMFVANPTFAHHRSCISFDMLISLRRASIFELSKTANPKIPWSPHTLKPQTLTP